ncbi:MAG: HK97 gp10 family phage protein [Rhodovulum sp.]|nr:HK97 gp10 family phage protein [Rhodovulum sp.]
MPADDELRRYFRDLPFGVKRKVAQAIKDQADGLASEIKEAAPVKTGRLRDSVQVRRGRNTLELVVTAGGEATTGEVRGGSGVGYDYALGTEFGNAHVAAQPFFFPTYREKKDEIDAAIRAAVGEALS